MPRLDDPEEFQLIKRIHGFDPELQLDKLEEEERLERQRHRNKTNQAR